MTTPDPKVQQWLQQNQRPERPPDQIYRRRLWIPFALAAFVGVVMAIINSPRAHSVPDPSPYVQVRVTAIGHAALGRCDLDVQDDEGDTGVLHGRTCEPVGSTTFAYLNKRGTLQVHPPLKTVHSFMRDVIAATIWFGIVLPFFVLASWLVAWRVLARRHGRVRDAELIDLN